MAKSTRSARPVSRRPPNVASALSYVAKSGSVLTLDSGVVHWEGVELRKSE